MPNFSLDDAVFKQAAERFPTPFTLYDEGGIRRAARALREAFSWNAGYRQYYAVKALPNPAILRVLMEEGCGLDCSSRTELLLAGRVGAGGADIMFSANAMPGGEFALARQMGAIINLDDLTDVALLAQNGGVPALASLRVNPGAGLARREGFMGGALDSKFGMTPGQVPEALEQLKALGLRRFGLHMMTDSNSMDAGYYPANAAWLFKLGLQMEARTGLALDFVNLSGGLGIPYRRGERPLDLVAVGEGVRRAYEAAFHGRRDVRIFTEPGRLLTGPYGWLVARVIHKKETWRGFVGLDASAANLLRPAMYGAWHHVEVVGKRDWPGDRVYDLTGPLCENNDKFAVARELPEIAVGDLVLLHDAGAHGHAMGYQYNGRLRGAEVLYTRGGEFRLIRRAETPEDYFATLVWE